MAESVTIARPYAQAVFRLAQEGKALALWSGRLQQLATIVQDVEMTKIVGNPKFSTRQIADLFVSLIGKTSDQELVSFITILAENERINVLPQIQEIYEQLKSADEGIKEAQL